MIVDENGKNTWIFESKEGKIKTNPVESKIFWIGLVIFPLAWIVSGVSQIFTFQFQWFFIFCVLNSL